jgi:hypothetical protein
MGLAFEIARATPGFLDDDEIGEEIEIDDKIFLTTTRPPFGGLRWWFSCPRSGRRVRTLYLPLGGRHFWSRRAYGLAYASQRGTAIDRAHRGQAKIKARLIGNLDPQEWDLPPKPKWMRWHTYNRLPEALGRSRRANWKHGYYSREAKAERSRVRAAILALRYLRIMALSASAPAN